MKLKVKYSNRFRKGLKLSVKRGLDLSLLEKIIEQLRLQQPLEPKYKDHELKGEWKGFRECHIQPDWLLIYLVEEDILTLTLVDTGSHADLFDM